MKKYYFAFIAFCFLSFANGQIINFPDANFKSRLLAASANNWIATNLRGVVFKIDSNNDGEIQESEALQVSFLNVSNSNITDLTGINFFKKLKILECKNNLITNLDVSSVGIDTIGGTDRLDCSNNMLTTLSLYNAVTGFKMYPRVLDCSLNQLTTLNFPVVNYYTTILLCYRNKLTSLNVDNNLALKELVCSFNDLTTLDISKNSNLTDLDCNDNKLRSLLMKKQIIPYNSLLKFSANPDLNFVCVKESDVAAIQLKLNEYGYTNCTINSYCTFTPVGTFYMLKGNNTFNSSSSNCGVSGLTFPFLKFYISPDRVILADDTGTYKIPFQQGTYNVQPYLDGNSNNFIITPSSLNIIFPNSNSPVIQNFCVSPNTSAVSNDLEIVILPFTPIVPGFITKYKLVFKNKGNVSQSGSVNLSFNDSILDLLTFNPALTSQGVNTVSWNFVNLLPHETREILITLKSNTPIDIPSVNMGDVLVFNASINSINNDTTPSDNSFNLTQTVVNSFDPNDKTCLEGATISPTKVGDYVHYMIRFENNGTANAQNVVIKDMIDLAKFDINSIVPIKGSHSLVTNITSGNKVEFIFENINLPFADATNDGYVAFKIKTKSTLVLGNTFSNSANIYFDYNFPIVTNTATTTVSNSLATQDFDFSEYIKLYPNPAKNILNIETNSDLKISSLSIYNTLGQLVQVITSPNKTIDVSELKTGNYFVKIVSDKGTSSSKFVKE